MLINMDLKGYSDASAVVPEYSVACANKVQARIRRKAVDVVYTTFAGSGRGHELMRSLFDNEQEAFAIQMHWDVMAGKYVCE